MTMAELITWCVARDACFEALMWLRKIPLGDPAKTAWARCQRGDWMLWLVRKSKVGTPKIILAGIACAKRARRYATDKKAFDRAIAAAENCAEERTAQNITEARNAAYAAARAARAAYAAYAAAARSAANAAERKAQARIIRRIIKWEDLGLEVSP